jgi:hypothetical protein
MHCTYYPYEELTRWSDEEDSLDDLPPQLETDLMERHLSQVEETLARISGDVDISRQIAENLKNVMFLDDLDAIDDARTARQVIGLMKRYPECTKVSFKGLHALALLFKDESSAYNSIAYSIVAAGGLEVILTAMEAANMSPLDVLKVGCYLLGSILRHSFLLPPEFMQKQLGPTRATHILIRIVMARHEACVLEASLFALLELGEYLRIGRGDDEHPDNPFYDSYHSYLRVMVNTALIPRLTSLVRRNSRISEATLGYALFLVERLDEFVLLRYASYVMHDADDYDPDPGVWT